MTPERPDYKQHPLWTAAMALAHEAYAVAEELRERDPGGARGAGGDRGPGRGAAHPRRPVAHAAAAHARPRAVGAPDPRGPAELRLLNDAEQKTRSRLLAAVVLVPLFLVAALWLPKWWEGRELSEARKIAGVGSQLTAGSMTDARKKVDPGLAADKIVAAIGKPGFAVGADGR